MQTLLFTTYKVAPLTPFDIAASFLIVVGMLLWIAKVCATDNKKERGKQLAKARRRRHQQRKAQDVHAQELVN